MAPYAELLDTLRGALPEASIVGDSTGAVYAGNFIVEMPAPRRWFNAATGYGTLGYGLPAALGAALANPERPVIALVGDGGLMFTLGELATARDAGVPLAVVVWNNDGYGEIRRYMDMHAVARLGVDLPAPDLATLAEAFGCHAARVDNPAALGQALTASQATTKPTLIEVDADAWGQPLSNHSPNDNRNRGEAMNPRNRNRLTIAALALLPTLGLAQASRPRHDCRLHRAAVARRDRQDRDHGATARPAGL